MERGERGGGERERGRGQRERRAANAERWRGRQRTGPGGHGDQSEHQHLPCRPHGVACITQTSPSVAGLSPRLLAVSRKFHPAAPSPPEPPPPCSIGVPGEGCRRQRNGARGVVPGRPIMHRVGRGSLQRRATRRSLADRAPCHGPVVSDRALSGPPPRRTSLPGWKPPRTPPGRAASRGLPVPSARPPLRRPRGGGGTRAPEPVEWYSGRQRHVPRQGRGLPWPPRPARVFGGPKGPGWMQRCLAAGWRGSSSRPRGPRRRRVCRPAGPPRRRPSRGPCSNTVQRTLAELLFTTPQPLVRRVRKGGAGPRAGGRAGRPGPSAASRRATAAP